MGGILVLRHEMRQCSFVSSVSVWKSRTKETNTFGTKWLLVHFRFEGRLLYSPNTVWSQCTNVYFWLICTVGRKGENESEKDLLSDVFCSYIHLKQIHAKGDLMS